MAEKFRLKVLKARSTNPSVKATRVTSSSGIRYSTIKQHRCGPWGKRLKGREKEEDCREEGTLSGHGGLGGHADPRADRHGPGDGNENGTDRGEGPPQERWRSAGVVGPACCRPAYRRGRPRVRRPASQIGIRGTIALGFSLWGRPTRPAQSVNTPRQSGDGGENNPPPRFVLGKVPLTYQV